MATLAVISVQADHTVRVVRAAGPTACPNYIYCSGTGWSTPTGTCAVGFYCTWVPTAAGRMHDNVTGGVCMRGYFCTADSDTAPCPSGTSNPFTGHGSWPRVCPALFGSYCADLGIGSELGPCLAGFYCQAQQTTSRPPDTVFLVGSFCPHTSLACVLSGWVVSAQHRR